MTMSRKSDRESYLYNIWDLFFCKRVPLWAAGMEEVQDAHFHCSADG